MANYRSDLVDLDLVYLRHSEKAVLVAYGKQESWVPLSQCETEPADLDSMKRGDSLKLTCQEWLAILKKLV